VPGQSDETWSRIDSALKAGNRGLPGGSSLARFLAAYRGVRNKARLPRLTIKQLLGWADSHHARTGAWPNRDLGLVHDDHSESWRGVDTVLKKGCRGFTGGSSLARVLAEHRGVRNIKGLPDLSVARILAWADDHHARTGVWPISASGPVAAAPGETWMAVQMALHHGRRGLQGGTSLAALLAKRRGVRNRMRLPRLSETRILAWADAHRRQTGQWPRKTFGPVRGVPGETWEAIDGALQKGCRGLTGGSSLPQLLAQHRGVRHRMALPRLTAKQILAWADAFREKSGRWPNAESGAIPGTDEERWSRIDACLRQGCRGLPGSDSLARLLARCRGVPMRWSRG
jgi:hypothetical protein